MALSSTFWKLFPGHGLHLPGLRSSLGNLLVVAVRMNGIDVIYHVGMFWNSKPGCHDSPYVCHNSHSSLIVLGIGGWQRRKLPRNGWPDWPAFSLAWVARKIEILHHPLRPSRKGKGMKKVWHARRGLVREGWGMLRHQEWGVELVQGSLPRIHENGQRNLWCTHVDWS